MALDRLRDKPGRLAGVALLVAATGLAFTVQVLAPAGVPLFDGQPVTEPYRYLHPSGSQPGDPTSYAADLPLTGSESPPVPAATTESPPQAQVIAQQGAFVLATGSTGLRVTITPIDPPSAAPGGQIAGNVYRFTVTDQAGKPLAIKACEGCISLVLRAPDGTGNARLQRFAGGAWSDVETFHAGGAGLYATNPLVLGDYAIVTGGSGVDGSGDGTILGLDFVQVLIAGGAAVILLLLFAAALLIRRRDPAPVPAPTRSIPSKRSKPGSRPGQKPRRPDR